MRKIGRGNIYSHMSIKIGEKIKVPNPSLTTRLVTKVSCTLDIVSRIHLRMEKPKFMGMKKSYKSQLYYRYGADRGT